MRNCSKDKWAMFYTSLLLPLKEKENFIGKGGVCQELKKLSKEEHNCPDGRRRKISLRTLKRRYKRMTGDFRDQMRKIRKDKGKSRVIKEAAIKRAVEIKKDQPDRSCKTIIDVLEKEGYAKNIKISTLSRHLLLEGAATKIINKNQGKIRRPFSVKTVGDLFVGDFENGPYVLHNGTSVPTYLSAFIDHKSRYVLGARYYLAGTLDILADSFLRAITEGGIPKRVYVDNAKVYRSNAFKEACLKLQTRLIFRKPYEPEGGGVIERFFQTCQKQFEQEVRTHKILNLNELNERFFAWLQIRYHKAVHSTIKAIPEKVFEEARTNFRFISSDLIKELFYLEEERVVDKKFAWISFKGHYYEVNKEYRGQKVKIYYDPFDFEEIEIYTQAGQYICTSKKGAENRKPKKELNQDYERPKSKIDYLGMLVAEHKEELRKQGLYPADQKSIIKKNRGFSFLEFCRLSAKLLGRQQNSFSNEEIEKLKKVYKSTKKINSEIVIKSAEQNSSKTLSELIYYIKQEIRGGKENE